MSEVSVDEATAIRERMQRLRSRLDDRAVQLAASTEQLLDWKTYARRHPFLMVATGLVSGMVIAPAIKSRKQPRTDVNSVRQPAPETVLASTRSNQNAGSLVAEVLRATVSPMLRQLVWGTVRGVISVQLDSLLQALKDQPGRPHDAMQNSERE